MLLTMHLNGNNLYPFYPHYVYILSFGQKIFFFFLSQPLGQFTFCVNSSARSPVIHRELFLRGPMPPFPLQSLQSNVLTWAVFQLLTLMVHFPQSDLKHLLHAWFLRGHAPFHFFCKDRGVKLHLVLLALMLFKPKNQSPYNVHMWRLKKI